MNRIAKILIDTARKKGEQPIVCMVPFLNNDVPKSPSARAAWIETKKNGKLVIVK